MTLSQNHDKPSGHKQNGTSILQKKDKDQTQMHFSFLRDLAWTCQNDLGQNPNTP